MDIKVLGSGSSGNCYRLDDGETQILLDAGLPIKEIRKRLNFKLSEISAVFITHEHGDHAKAAKELSRIGIPVHGSQGTMEAIGLQKGAVKQLKTMKIGTFAIMPFDLVHDAAEPTGFLITSSKTKEKLVYITDTQNCPYDFKNLTHIMVEINYCDDLMAENVEDGITPKVLAKRTARNHMGLKEGIAFLKRNAGPELCGVWILHLSNANSDEEVIKNTAQRAIGVPIIIC